MELIKLGACTDQYRPRLLICVKSLSNFSLEEWGTNRLDPL